jgi:methylenetetrahydrofolate dehydrogenase (NADP+)/methenyltetrahydrofolate cyclohydrolase
MQLLDGVGTAQRIQDRIREEAAAALDLRGRTPHLAAVLVGDDPASQVYVGSKVKTCEALGFGSTLIRRDANTSEAELLQIIRELNADAAIDGILVQLPLPKHISENAIINAIDPAKDVDGFHPVSQGNMVLGQPTYLPATPFGIQLLLAEYGIDVSGKHAVVIGRSNIVGTPMSILLSRSGTGGNATVTLTHSRTQNLKELCLQADIIVAAIGKPRFVTADMVKEGAIIIDVGINRIEDASRKSGSRLVGDVDFDAVAPKCSYITPVPKGVGPMTICGLMMNTLKAWKAGA